MSFLSGLKIFKFRSAWAKIAGVVIDKTKGKIDLVAYGFTDTLELALKRSA